MAKEVYEWFRVAAQNNFAFADGGMPEGMDRQQVNDSGREQMRALREMYDTKSDSSVGLEFLDLMRNPTDATAFAVSRQSASVIRIVSGTNDMSSYFNVDRRIRTYTAGVLTDELFVESVSYTNPNTDVTIRTLDGDSVTAGIDGIKLHVGATMGRLAFDSTVDFPFTIPAGLTDADFNTALATISAQGGGIIFLRAGTHVLTSQKSITHPIWILGQGKEFSILKVNDGANLASLFTLTGVAARDCHFSNFTLDGNRANQTGGDGDGFLISNRASHISFYDVHIKSTRRDGVRMSNTSATSDVFDVRFDGMTFEDTGGDGIQSIDAQSTMHAISAHNLSILSPGQEQVNSAGIRVAGQWELANIRVGDLDLGGGNTQRGIWFLERLAIDPNPQDAHQCTLTNFHVEGTGANARGVECHGERNMISNGTVKLTGAVSRGVLMGGTLGQQTPLQNRLTNVLVEDCNIGVLLESSCAELAIGAGVLTRNCTTGVDVAGDRLEICGCRIEGGTTGIDVKGTCADVVIEGNKIAGMSGTGVNIVAGATDTVVRENTFRSVGGSDIVDAGTDTIWGDNHPAQERNYTIETGGNYAVQNARTAITNFTALPLPGLGGNGTRNFELNASFTCEIRISGAGDPGELELSCHLGPAGTTGDPIIATGYLTDEAADALEIVRSMITFCGLQLTAPASGDVITFSALDGAEIGTIFMTSAVPAYCEIKKLRD